ncbi:hypothetical protein FN846DRAFT_912533 [Sphaerosporella brunnea]|uniref:Uncharacterized protein n=1 Tax=Sphaerosporella brunnea TaxID=1250544 RepID=A0A5J5EH90_9PEZI|nr:hypothetical protein FN846DRAFT_912533 [Sphaerosporella brunnea]
MSAKTTVPMSSGTARGLHYWPQANNLEHQEARNILTGAFAVAFLVHAGLLCDLYGLHSGSSYPELPHNHGIYSIIAAVVVSVLAIAGFAGSVYNYIPRTCISTIEFAVSPAPSL